MQQPEYVTRLINTYIKAQDELIRIISEKDAKGNSYDYERSLLSQVSDVLKETNQYSLKWSQEVITDQYRKGVDEVVNQILSQGKSVAGFKTFAALHTKAIEILVRNTVQDLTDATNFVGRQIQDTVRQAGLEAAAQKLGTGATVRQMKLLLQQKLIDEGLNGIRDKRGRLISLDAYASTVARSTTREATNTATMNHTKALGYDLVQMSSHATKCPICAALQGRVYSLTGRTPGYPVLTHAFGSHANIHPNCVIGETLVSGSLALGATARYYEGKMFVINTSFGKELTVTPNHPILTPKGWVVPRLLNVGDEVVNYIGSEGVVSGVPNDVEVPPTIEDVTRSFFESSQVSAVSVKVTAEDFHGDGMSGDIAVVLSNSFLGNGLESFGNEEVFENDFIGTAVASPSFNAESTPFQLLNGMLATPNGCMCGGSVLSPFVSSHSSITDSSSFGAIDGRHDATLFQPFVDNHFSAPVSAGNVSFGYSADVLTNHQVNIERNSFGARTQNDTLFFENAVNSLITDKISASNLLDSLSGQVEFDQIIGIREIDFCGHVYNLHTKGNWFAANGIITHNCRHVITPYIVGLADDPEGDKVFSNRPFDIDPRSQADIDRYNDQQRKLRKLREDRNQFQRYKLALGADAPKTLSGFRRVKAADGERWQQMQSDYREVLK